MKNTLTTILSLALIAGMALPAHAATKKVTVPDSISASELREKYQNALASGEKVKILIVPGHEPMLGGTEYQGYYERELVLVIAERLAKSLATNPRYEVMTTRDFDGWNPDLANYFEKEEKRTQKFVRDQKKAFEKKLKRGRVEERTEEVPHAVARDDIAYRLYAVNRYANDNDVDVVVHLHINDSGGDPQLRTGYDGFAIYVPDDHYANAAASRPIAESIAKKLNAFSATSTLPIENQGIVPDQELIAIGAYDTLAAPSVLIEYGYITEEKFLNLETRAAVSTDFAYQTYLGLQDFFGDPLASSRPTLALPYAWKEGEPETGASAQTYALQAALRTLGYYPTFPGMNLVACPISGIWNECTTNALKAFQAAKGLEQTGAIGPKTKAALTAAGV